VPWRLLRTRQGDLLTAALLREDGLWTASWEDGYFEPVEPVPTLDELARTIDSLVRDRYRTGTAAPPCLQHAIYPWGRVDVFRVVAPGHDPGLEHRPHAAFHILGSFGDFRARDISGSSAGEVSGGSLDQLVSEVSALLGDWPTVSFRLIREIRSDGAE
jgi:hypothetical protein